jgi:uncharacterized protein (DUF2141 family)
MPILRIQPRHPAKSIIALALVAMAAWAPVAIAADPDTATLTVTFHGLKSHAGKLMMSLSASPAAYAEKEAPAGQASLPVDGDTVSTTFTGLKPGSYAIKAFHDVNGDGKLNTNPFGIPTEPYAFSNDARGRMGPAPWSAAEFTLAPGDNSQTIDID